MKIQCVIAAVLFVGSANAQTTAPSVSQVLMYSATIPSLTVPTLNGAPSFTLRQAVPAIFSETAVSTNLVGDGNFLNVVSNGANFSVNRNFVQVASALNASIATALSIIPLSSPASGVITRKDPATGAFLPESSTLGPIFTERAETIGKRHFYIGFSNQVFHFTKFNGVSLNSQNILYTGGDASKILNGTASLTTTPASFGLGLDVKLSQSIAFLTYGVTDRFDLSVGLPVIHSAVASRTYNATIYAGNGFGNPTCWCANTFTPGFPTLIQSQVGQASANKTGFGDLLIRAKGTVLRSGSTVIALGADVRLPTGDEENYLGVGATSVKPFVAMSFYSKEFGHGLVLSPHFDAGYQYTGKSILGGQLQGTPLTQQTSAGTVTYIGAPFTTTKDYIPDVFSWAAGVELAAGRRNTFIADILGNQIGLSHGIPNAINRTLDNLSFPTSVNGDPSGLAKPNVGSVTGLVSAGNVKFGQYTASVGYKIKLAGNLIANFNALIRLDDNGLKAPVVPMFGLSYSF